MKFDSVIQHTYRKLTEALPPPAGTVPQQEPIQGPETAPTEIPQVTKLTPEGKRFLIELAVKCLSIDPHNLTDPDKAIFDEEITPENAETVLNRIQQITSGSDVESSAGDSDAVEGGSGL